MIGELEEELPAPHGGDGEITVAIVRASWAFKNQAHQPRKIERQAFKYQLIQHPCISATQQVADIQNIGLRKWTPPP